MGKTRRERKKPKVANPIATPAANAQDTKSKQTSGEGSSWERSSVCDKEIEILTIIEQLQSPNVEDKIFGLHSLATAFEDTTSVINVVRHKVVKMAGPLLIERSAFVRNAAAGALRNLSACGSQEICELLVEQDVMTPLTVLLQQYAAEWALRPRKAGKEDLVDEPVDTFVQAVHLLWNLCENSSLAVKYFNDNNLIPVLAKCLNYGAVGLDVSVVVAHCLNTVTEDNVAACEKLKKAQPVIMQLVRLDGSDNASLVLRTLACGLLLNIYGSKVSALAPTSVTLVMKCLSEVLDVDQRRELHTLSSELKEDEVGNVLMAGHLLDAQKTAIEILTNVCSDDAEEEAMDQDQSDTSDETFVEADLEDGERFTPSIASEVHEAVVSYQLLRKVWEKTTLPAENVVNILREHKHAKTLPSKLAALQCQAFHCLNNLLSVLDMEEVGGPDNLYKLWLDVGRLVFQQEADPKVLEAATSAMRAALQRLAEAKACGLFGQLTEADVQLMFTAAQQCTDANVRANLIRCVGTLGTILSHSADGNGQTLIKNMGKFLVDVSCKETELWVAAEALDVIMDVFGEDSTDAAAAEIGLVDKLQALLPSVKHKVRLQRKTLGDHTLLVTTVNGNLARFIKYKSDRLLNLSAEANGHANGLS